MNDPTEPAAPNPARHSTLHSAPKTAGAPPTGVLASDLANVPPNVLPNILADVQSQAPAIPLRINRVGIRGLTMPILVRQRDHSEAQRTVADISFGVDLPAGAKGTHMSRFVETLQGMARADGGSASECAALDYALALRLMRETCARLDADRAHLAFSFPYFLARPAPASGIRALMAYHCTLSGDIDRTDSGSSAFSPFTLAVAVPVMTVCPCSKAISDEGAHSQRAEVRISARMKGYVWIEELIEMAEEAGSSPIYSLLKRTDEKFVTEHAFARPRFVEDVVRRVAFSLAAHPRVSSFSVEVESQESIHAHNAFARIEG